MAGFQNREHFLRASAIVMRHLLIDYARERVAEKRGGESLHVALDDIVEPGAATNDA